jgi:2-methylcitrate dehydratase PrpD
MPNDAPLLASLSDFVHRTRFEDLPPPVVKAAKWRLLDLLGSALWGVHVGTASAMRAVVEPLGGVEESTVLGRHGRLPALWASYLNSCASPALLDTCRFSVTHPGIVTMPAALAVAEQFESNGKDFITAVAVGYEILIRLGKATRPTDRGFVPTAVLGPFAAAAAAAKLMSLDAQQTLNALALAATMGAGLLEAYAAIESGRNQFGRACQSGVLAAMLAAKGMKGNPRMLEGGGLAGTRGFVAAFSDHFDPAALTADLGLDFGLPNVAPKIHDGCRYANAAADATLQLVREHGLRAQQVQRVRIRTFALALKVSVRKPTTVSGALFCLEFIVATALLSGDVFNDKFTLERLADPQTQHLMALTDVSLDDEIEREYPGKLGLAMEVDTVDGHTLTCRLDFPKGEPENPLTAKECEDKFRHLSTPMLSTGRSSEIISVVASLERLANLSTLTHLCRTAPTRDTHATGVLI